MTETSISLFSIIIGILGACFTKWIFDKKKLHLTEVIIAGVFCSVFLIKTFGRLGFDPRSVMESGELNFLLLIVNLSVSFLGGVLSFYILLQVKSRLNK